LPRNHFSILFLILVAAFAIFPASSIQCYPPLRSSPNNITCIKPCSDYQFYYEGQKTCKDHCPRLGRQWTVQGVKLCEEPCPWNLILHMVGKYKECVSECPSGFKEDVIDTIRQCTRICSEEQFYSELGSPQCIEECPFLEDHAKGGKVCKFPCQKNEFWNPGSNECTSECLGPLVKETIVGMNLCKYPCQKGEFWDQDAKTCNETCPTPYRIRSGYLDFQSCEKPCDSNDLYWVKERNRCEKQCSPFHVPDVVGNVKICKLPCSKGTYYNTENKTCQDSCRAPWQSQQDSATRARICFRTCKSDEILTQKGCKKEGCLFPWIIKDLDGILICSKPCPEFQIWDNGTQSCRNSCAE